MADAETQPLIAPEDRLDIRRYHLASELNSIAKVVVKIAAVYGFIVTIIVSEKATPWYIKSVAVCNIAAQACLGGDSMWRFLNRKTVRQIEFLESSVEFTGHTVGSLCRAASVSVPEDLYVIRGRSRYIVLDLLNVTALLTATTQVCMVFFFVVSS